MDTIFQNIVTGQDNVHADLKALGLPRSWARYAGTYYWDRKSVRNSPLYVTYEPELTDTNVARFLLTHPDRIWGIAQHAAVEAQVFRVTELGTYAPSAGHKKGAFESRVIVITWLMRQLPSKLGLYALLPAWLLMAGIALLALLRRRGPPWHRHAAVAVLGLIGCAFVAFIPPGFFEGISTTRHMVGMNLATWLSIPLSVGLARLDAGPAGDPPAAGPAGRPNRRPSPRWPSRPARPPARPRRPYAPPARRPRGRRPARRCGGRSRPSPAAWPPAATRPAPGRRRAGTTRTAARR